MITSKFSDHVMAAKCAYVEIPSIFKQGNPLFGERGEKKYLYFVKPICIEHY